MDQTGPHWRDLSSPTLPAPSWQASWWVSRSNPHNKGGQSFSPPFSIATVWCAQRPVRGPFSSCYLSRMKKLILFDIDGTILSSAGAGRRAIQRAIVERFGPDYGVDGVRFDGKTDPQIVTELLYHAGHADEVTTEMIAAVCERYLRYLESELEAARERIALYPGVRELLSRLTHRKDCIVGLLTGNIERGAYLKLASAGLDTTLFRVGAFGSDAAHRPDLPPIAAARASELMGRVPTNHDVVILGDTPADVTCGQSIGARAIGVATGSYPLEDLQSAGAFSAFGDFSDSDAVEQAIFV